MHLDYADNDDRPGNAMTHLWRPERGFQIRLPRPVNRAVVFFTVVVWRTRSPTLTTVLMLPQGIDLEERFFADSGLKHLTESREARLRRFVFLNLSFV